MLEITFNLHFLSLFPINAAQQIFTITDQIVHTDI